MQEFNYNTEYADQQKARQRYRKETENHSSIQVLEAEGIPSVIDAHSKSIPAVAENNANTGEDSSKNFSHRQLDDIQKSILRHQTLDGKMKVKTPQCEARGGKDEINIDLLQGAIVHLEEAAPIPSGSPPHQ